MKTKQLWFGFITVMVVSFAVLLYYGSEIYRQAPPIPDKVLADDGRVLFTGKDIRDGQNVWQSLGGQEIGTIWGHGAYQAPDWSADWLHREAMFMLNAASRSADSVNYDRLDDEKKAALRVRLQKELRMNTYDRASATIKVSVSRAAAIEDRKSTRLNSVT